MRSLFFSMLVGLLVLVPTATLAGDLDATKPPADAGSAMFTIKDIYNRLNDGTDGGKRAGAFTEPGAGPAAGGTGQTLDDVMDKAPVRDDANGAIAADVPTGKKFWGLTGGEWGLKTGTASGGGGCTAGVPKTGQTSTEPIPAPAGSDGALGKGVAWPSPRFTDNSDGTVTDNMTGLIWLKNAQCSDEAGGKTPASGKLDWADALEWCNAMKDGICGLGDSSVAGAWRLPNVRELYSLIDHRYSDPAVPNTAGTGQWTTDGAPFDNVQSGYYWSATTYADSTTVAWQGC